MNESTTPSRGDDQLLLQFQQECEAAADRTALLEEWCARAPHLAKRLRARVEMAAMLARTRPQADEATPQQLGEFKIVRRLGVSMGEVFEAWQPSLKRRVAIKTIRRGRISPEARDLFLREQQVLAGLHQTHIVPIHAAGEEAGLQYFVMPYIDGAALHHVVHLARNWNSSATAGKTPPLKELAKQAADRHQGSPVPAGHCTTLDAVSAPDSPADQPPAPPLSSAYFRSVAQVMSDAADALQHAHDAHILHRDLKPSNLMVDRQGHCWIIDFGLAGVLTTAPGDSASKNGLEAKGNVNDTPPTVSGIMGTPPYMAPEQWHGTADQRSDVYGLGVTLYELLTLTRAFAGEDRDAIQRQVMAGMQRSPRQAAPNIPLDLDAICTKAMNKDAVKRYSTPKMFAEDLRNWLNGQQTLARPAWWPRRLGLWAKRNKGWATALTLLMIVLAIGASALGMIQERNREAERQNLIRQAQGRRLNFRGAGWSKEAWAQLRQAAHIRVDDLLRSEAASSLMGLDVVRPKEFKDEGACSLAFHPSGKKLILGAQPVRKNRREPKNPRLPIRIRDQDTDVVKETTIFDVGPVAYDKQGKPLALTVKKNEAALVLWDVETEKPLRELTFPQKTTGQVAEWVLSADGAAAAARVPFDKEKSLIVAWNTATGEIIRQEEKLKTGVMALSPDGKFLAAGDAEGRVEVFSLEKKEASVSWKTGRLNISALAFGTNPRRAPGELPWVLATGNQGGNIAIWDLADQSVRGLLQGSAHDVFALEFSHDGVLLASSGRSEPHIWNVAAGKIILELPFHDYATALAFSPQGDRLAIANFHSPFYGLEIQVVRLENGRGLMSFHGLSGQIEFVEFSKDGSLLAALSHQWQIGVWNTKTGGLLHVFQPRPGLWIDNAGLALSDDNQTLAFTTSQHAFVWDLRTAKEHAFALFPGMVDRLAFHSDLGKFLSFRVETENGKEWPLAAKTDFNLHPRVCRIRALTAKGLEDLGAIKDFNKAVVSTGMARNASVIAVEGFAEDQKGLARTVRVYSLPARAELWNNSSSTKWTGGGVLPLDPEGKVLFWNDATDKGAAIRPRLVDLKTGQAEEWQLSPLCLGPQGKLALVRDIDPVVKRTLGVSLHRGSTKTPLASFATNLAVTHGTQFTRQGEHFAWGTTDGAVILCDIAAARAKLGELRLGW